jgi:diacylglycerol diphosphate phosphatase/phosphatidate phosphatase
VGLVGAAARFYQRSYAADYIALGFLAMGWLVVSRYFSLIWWIFSLTLIFLV